MQRGSLLFRLATRLSLFACELLTACGFSALAAVSSVEGKAGAAQQPCSSERLLGRGLLQGGCRPRPLKSAALEDRVVLVHSCQLHTWLLFATPSWCLSFSCVSLVMVILTGVKC